MTKWVLVLTLALLAGCCGSGPLSVKHEYLDYRYLASSHVDTPDPRKECGFCGQRLVIRWSLPLCYRNCPYLRLVVTMRMRNEQEREVVVPLRSRVGTYVYRVVDREYFETDGILTYKVELYCGETLIQDWEHQVWTRLIEFSDS